MSSEVSIQLAPSFTSVYVTQSLTLSVSLKQIKVRIKQILRSSSFSFQVKLKKNEITNTLFVLEKNFLPAAADVCMCHTRVPQLGCCFSVPACPCPFLRAGKQHSSRLAQHWETLLSCCSEQFRQDLLLTVSTCVGLTCVDKLWCERPWHGDQILCQGEVSTDHKDSKRTRLCKVSACCRFPLLSKFSAASADVRPEALQLSWGRSTALITQVSSDCCASWSHVTFGNKRSFTAPTNVLFVSFQPLSQYRLSRHCFWDCGSRVTDIH